MIHPNDHSGPMRLRFKEKKSYPQIAEALGVSEHAAQRIVGKALAKTRGW